MGFLDKLLGRKPKDDAAQAMQTAPEPPSMPAEPAPPAPAEEEPHEHQPGEGEHSH
jgi:hypothetical protein